MQPFAQNLITHYDTEMKPTLRNTLSLIRNLVVAVVIFAALYYFYLFFAYDLNPNFVQIDQCKRYDGIWNAETKRCSLK